MKKWYVLALILLSFSSVPSHPNADLSLSVLSTKNDIRAITTCISELAARAPFLFEGDRLRNHSALRVINRFFDTHVEVDLFDDCSSFYGPNWLDDPCGRDTLISCKVDLRSDRVLDLSGPENPVVGLERVEYIKFRETPQSRSQYRQLLEQKAQNGEVMVSTSKRYEYFEDHWAQVGETTIQCEAVADILRDWDEAERESEEDGARRRRDRLRR